MDKVTPEMQQAYVDWDAPDLPGYPITIPAFLGWLRTAFFAGYKAGKESK